MLNLLVMAYGLFEDQFVKVCRTIYSDRRRKDLYQSPTLACVHFDDVVMVFFRFVTSKTRL